MKRLVFFTIFITLIGCGGGSSSSDVASNSEAQDAVAGAAIFHAIDGSGYSEFIDLEMKSGGYLDITNFKSSVALYSQSLALIDNELTSEDFIEAGEYKLKLTYSATSLIPGTVSIFSLDLVDFANLAEIESSTYSATGALGTYSLYYKLTNEQSGYIDVSTTKASVYIYNYTLFGNDGMPLSTHYELVEANKYLDAGEYLIKFTYNATSLTPGTVTFARN